MSWFKKEKKEDPYDQLKNDDQQYLITNKQIRKLYAEIAAAQQAEDKAYNELMRMTKLYKLSCALSRKTLDIIERVKDRYPFLWNECTDEEDSEDVVNLIQELDDECV